jgi:HIV-1 Vpr-binding protein
LSSRPNQASNISHTPQQPNLSLNSGKAENHLEKSGVDRAQTSMADTRERRDGTSEKGLNGSLQGNVSQPTGLLSPAATLVGDRRISLGSVAGGSGIAANMEQGYRQACDAVRANNGIKVLLHLLHPRTVLPPASLDCIRALACRVLLGLSKDDAIAHILTKLQV